MSISLSYKLLENVLMEEKEEDEKTKNRIERSEQDMIL